MWTVFKYTNGICFLPLYKLLLWKWLILTYHTREFWSCVNNPSTCLKKIKTSYRENSISCFHFLAFLLFVWVKWRLSERFWQRRCHRWFVLTYSHKCYCRTGTQHDHTLSENGKPAVLNTKCNIKLTVVDILLEQFMLYHHGNSKTTLISSSKILHPL